MTREQIRLDTEKRLARMRGRLKAGSRTKRRSGLREFVVSIGLAEGYASHLNAFLRGEAKPTPALVQALGYRMTSEVYEKERGDGK